MKPKSRINKKAFREVYERHLNPVDCLSLTDVGNIFGQEFWEMLVYALMDSGEASRAIAGAIARLKAGEKADA